MCLDYWVCNVGECENFVRAPTPCDCPILPNAKKRRSCKCPTKHLRDATTSCGQHRAFRRPNNEAENAQNTAALGQRAGGSGTAGPSGQPQGDATNAGPSSSTEYRGGPFVNGVPGPIPGRVLLPDLTQWRANHEFPNPPTGNPLLPPTPNPVDNEALRAHRYYAKHKAICPSQLRVPTDPFFGGAEIPLHSSEGLPDRPNNAAAVEVLPPPSPAYMERIAHNWDAEAEFIKPWSSLTTQSEGLRPNLFWPLPGIPHPSHEKLTALGYVEPEEWELWRSHRTDPEGAGQVYRSDAAVDGLIAADPDQRYRQARDMLPLWPLPLPYEPFRWFVERQKYFLARGGNVDDQMMIQQFWWRQENDPALQFSDGARYEGKGKQRAD